MPDSILPRSDENSSTPLTREQFRTLSDTLGGGRTIAFRPLLAHACGGATIGLLLSQFWYYTNMETAESRDGWFYKTQTDITEETGMTRTETETARKKLVSLGILSEDRRGIPAKMWFRVNKERLFEVLFAFLEPSQRAEDAERTPEQIERIIAIYKTNLQSLSASGYSRAVKLGAKAEMVSYEEILRRDGGRCHICGEVITQGPGQKKGDTQFDHVIPLNGGGSHTADNIKTAHVACNARKSDGDLHLRVAQSCLPKSHKQSYQAREVKSAGAAQSIPKTSPQKPETHQRPAATPRDDSPAALEEKCRISRSGAAKIKAALEAAGKGKGGRP